MKNIFIASCLFATLTFSSCSDFLDVKPTESADASVSIKTAADAQIMMRGIMSKLSNSNYYGRNFPLYADTKGGDFTIVSQGRGYDYLYTFNHSESSNNYSGIWTQGYHTLAQINNLLNQIEVLKENGSGENFDSYIGQALTLRALIYFDLVRLYGKNYNDNKTSFGVPLTTTLLGADDQLGRNTVEEVYTQILADLKASEDLLPKTKTNGFINHYGNKALQARVYLYQEDFNNALAAAESIISSNAYSLYSNANWVGSWAAQYGTESIFELAMLPSEGDLGTTSLGIYYRNKSHGTTAALGYFTASTNFINLLNEDTDDVRKGIMINDELGRLGALYKYSGSTTLAGDGKGNATAVNIKVIRLSEVYLIAAEAALRLSTPDRAKAANYLNQIRKRSPNLPAATEATVTQDMISNERAKELAGEGHKFFDMMRLNKTVSFDDALGGIITTHRDATIDRSHFKTILPIPLAEINANPVIDQQQNPGYRN